MTNKKESELKNWDVEIRKITSNDNPRYPCSAELEKKGYGIFEGNAKKPFGLWELAVSENIKDRAEYVRLINEFDPEIKAGAMNMLAVGQQQAIGVMENEDGTFKLIYGARRCLQLLYIWCAGLSKASEPIVRAVKLNVNDRDAQIMARSENMHRKQMNPIEIAKAWKADLNLNVSKVDIAREANCDVQTVTRYVKLLELNAKDQARVASKEWTVSKALKKLAGKETDGEEKKLIATGKQRVSKRPAPIIKEELDKFKDDEKIKNCLLWVLCLRDTIN